MSGHPRLALKEGVDARHKAGHDEREGMPGKKSK
jgi:hypothetical protein